MSQHPPSKDWTTLEDYVLSLLKDGKRSNHPDFQSLFLIYGKAKVTEMAQKLLRKEREKENDGPNTR